MKAIGGYFELELSNNKEYHSNAICLNSGRNAFEYILRAKEYKKVYLPYYTCEVMLEPIEKLNIEIEFYSINEKFTPIFDFTQLGKTDVFVYTNYFGICDKQVLKLSKEVDNLIVDNSQAFYSIPLPNIDTFYSPRKFFGLADGAYLFTDKKLNLNIKQDISMHRVQHLLGRIEKGAEEYYKFFQENDNKLKNQPIKRMSELTKRMLKSIDYDDVAYKRRTNFKTIHNILKEFNNLTFNLENTSVPMVYPFWISNGSELKKVLINNKVFTSTYWENVKDWTSSGTLEYEFTENVLFIPIDQRYNEKDLLLIVDLLGLEKGRITSA
ncbi:hypothetical protein SAMN05216474_1416 [Lishizhenia tianjinensis]|uniref:dTDP-4-amino-4,6-dideoxygalactose transaminase n=1 Tax=Lishizhenia tianjinensis TaxID=477690 RepID=A0A1I6ZJK4_9FLAO|nr:hypothetical protein [Lishizhenia tianjinensis]SFT62874.1 hypothetical protein SAMN05216474_1416 [Lishizhenia tianjinensis]